MDDSTAGQPPDPAISQPAAYSDLSASGSGKHASPALAGFGLRLGARVFDYLVVAYSIMLGAFALGDCSIPSCQTLKATFLVVVFFAVAAYEILPTARFGRTLGKSVAGIKVVRADGDGPQSFGRAALRFLVLLGLHILAFPLMVLVSFVASVRNPRKQMWHDRVGRTIVVLEREAAAEPTSGPLPRRPDRESHDDLWNALILGVAALALTLPAIPDFTLEALGSEYLDATSTTWTSVMWLAAPLFGVASLLLASKAQRRIDRSRVRLSDQRFVTAARVVAWVGAASWSLTFLGAAAVGL